ncbi:MAG: PilZ domain-containing protein, partial [Syntrophobacteraceae bacterium]
SPACRFFLGPSQKRPDVGLCSNPSYLKVNENCLAVLGRECDYFSAEDPEPEQLSYELQDYAGRENRSSIRNLTYNSILIRTDKNGSIEKYHGIILDVSLEGIGFVIPVVVDSFPDEFLLIDRHPGHEPVNIVCETRRIIEHSNTTEIGAVFREPISEDLMALLLKAW